MSTRLLTERIHDSLVEGFDSSQEDAWPVLLGRASLKCQRVNTLEQLSVSNAQQLVELFGSWEGQL